MPFEKGVSGNPRGRPPGGTSVAEYVRAKAGSDGRRYVDLLDELAMDEKQPARSVSMPPGFCCREGLEIRRRRFALSSPTK